jgi:outer membrane protein OmpA-like peptidoglycan-associated protein
MKKLMIPFTIAIAFTAGRGAHSAPSINIANQPTNPEPTNPEPTNPGPTNPGLRSKTMVGAEYAPLRVLDRSSSLQVTVTNNADTIAPDDGLTLREAIALTNGSLSPSQLSEAERRQVSATGSATGSTTSSATGSTTGQVSSIQFNLPVGQTKIQLSQPLPDIIRSVTIDGTTQPGYPQTAVFSEIPHIRRPVVEITTADGVEILRGLTITADRVTVQGLSLYGFTSTHGITASTPPADIFIAHQNPPPDLQAIPATDRPFAVTDIPPQDITIRDNWLGLKPDQSMPDKTSAFGVSVFNASHVKIQNNWIANHDGSGIITGLNASQTTIAHNLLIANGIAGMPDAIRLEGNIDQSRISSNLLCGNDGSAIYTFKPQGAVSIERNRIVYNGRRLRRAAIYLMGNDHQVLNNTIAHQTAAGVVIAANPDSARNLIDGNTFANLEGLSIDLNTWNNTDVSDQQRGDGINPQRDSGNRRQETGNGAINAPQFKTRTFPIENTDVTIRGYADNGSTVKIYRVNDRQTADNQVVAGPLSEELFTITNVQNGEFAINIDSGLKSGGLKSGDVISAVAIDPNYGTSEPAINALIGTVNSQVNSQVNPRPNPMPPACITPPAPPPIVPQPPPESPIVLKVPKNVHFALDQSFISQNSASVLDKVAAVLRDHPTIIIELQGHTDPRASDAYNIELGKNRAISTRNYLIKQGIDPARMTIRTFGKRQRKTSGNTRFDYARDRRTEIIYTDIRDIEVIVQEDDLQIEP